MRHAFPVLARLKRLRGTWADLFGRTAERRRERAMIAAFEADLDLVAERLTPTTQAACLTLLELPSEVRGFGHVKEAAMDAYDAARATAHAAIAEARALAAE